MVPLTRRSLLHGATGAAAALAGCSGLLDGTAESARTATRGEKPADGRPGSASETDPDVLLIRAGGDRPPVWLSDPDGDGGRQTPRDGERHLGSAVIDGPSRADRLSVADGAGRDRVDSFLAATDFGAETLYLETIRVGECFRLDLCHVAWRPTRVSTDYARRVRPYDERCAADERVFEARLIRIPDTIDADRVNEYSSSVGTGACDRNRSRARAEGEAGSGSPTPAGSSSPTPAGTDTAEGGGEQ